MWHCFVFWFFFAFEEGAMESNTHLYTSKAYWYDPCKSIFQIPTSTVLGSWLTHCCLLERAGFWIFTKPPPTSKLCSFLWRWPDVVWHGLCTPLGLTWGIKGKKISEFDWSLHRVKKVKAVIPNFSYIRNRRLKVCGKSWPSEKKKKVWILPRNAQVSESEEHVVVSH